MHVLAIASRKGGSGKTTLTGHLSVEAERQGHGPVAIMDIDPQGSLADWWNERQTSTPVFVNTSLETLADDIERLRAGGIRTVIVDTPPAITGAIRQVVDTTQYTVRSFTIQQAELIEHSCSERLRYRQGERAPGRSNVR